MLVLSRRSQEAVVVGGSGRFDCVLKVIVLEINGSRVRLGFEVDEGVPVHRLEVWERIQSGGPPVERSTGPPSRMGERSRSRPLGALVRRAIEKE